MNTLANYIRGRLAVEYFKGQGKVVYYSYSDSGSDSGSGFGSGCYLVGLPMEHEAKDWHDSRLSIRPILIPAKDIYHRTLFQHECAWLTVCIMMFLWVEFL